MPTPEVDALKTAFSWATSLDEIATGVVVLGVLVELVAIWFDREMARWQRIALIPAAALVVVGVAGELIFGGRAASAASRLQQLSDERVAELQSEQARDHRIATSAAAHAADLGVTVDSLQTFVRKKQALADANVIELKALVNRDKAASVAAVGALNNVRASLETARKDAITSASAATEDLNQTRQDVAQVESLLQQERSLHQELVTVLTPRGLSDEQQLAIAQRLSGFAPMRVDIITCGDTAEIADLGRSLTQTLARAGWRPKVFAAINGASLGVHGVPILVRSGAKRASAAAAELAQDLLSAQVSARVVGQFAGNDAPTALYGPTWENNDVADVRVLVGVKP